MTDAPDTELLAQFTRDNSETAFATLVERHIGLVHSVALRHATQPQHAQDITQAVFIILAKKADKLSKHAVLPGWLYNTARLTAANFQRTEARRIRREQEAYMQSTLEETAPENLWREMSPLLDEAMAHLGPADRDALVLRYFQNKTLLEVGAALGLEERAAQKRVTRAVEKLRKIFIKRGVTLTATAIAGAVSTNSVQAAPAVLVKTISAVAVAKGAAATTSTLTLVKGTMKMMTWMKIKFAVGLGVIALLAGGAATVAVSQTGGGDTLTPMEIAKQSQDAYAALTSYSDSGIAVTDVGGHTVTTTFSIKLQRPNQYRIAWTQSGYSGGANSEGMVWSDGTGDYFLRTVGNPKPGEVPQPQKMENMQLALASATGFSGTVAVMLPGTFFDFDLGLPLGLAASGRTDDKIKPDEVIDGENCHVFSSVLDTAKLKAAGKLPRNMGRLGTATSTTTLWIGKHDHLIHKILTSVDSASMAPAELSDADIKGILESQKLPVTPAAIASTKAALASGMKNAAKIGKASFTQTHSNIVVNQKFSPADFAR